MIFPRIEESRLMIESLPVEQQDMAAQAFLDLLELCRVVLLQDIIFVVYGIHSLVIKPPTVGEVR
jgi:hypothetical protein